MLDENAATISRPLALVKISSNASMTSVSDPVKPRRSTLVLSASSASTPSVPSSPKRCRSKCSPSIGVWSILKSPVWTMTPDRGVNGERHAVRHAVRDADELDLERTDGDAIARADGVRRTCPRGRVPAASRSTIASVSGRPVNRSVDVRHDVRHAADVILVSMRQHERGGAASSAAGT